jgi:hypothetical protein
MKVVPSKITSSILTDVLEIAWTFSPHFFSQLDKAICDLSRLEKIVVPAAPLDFIIRDHFRKSEEAGKLTFDEVDADMELYFNSNRVT